MSSSVLQVLDLKVFYWTSRGPVRAVDGVSFDLRRGERFGLAGESGSGKSTAALALLRLIKPPGRVEGGSVLLEGNDLLRLNAEQMRDVRWKQISFTPQGAMNSLNPVIRIRRQVEDGIVAHEGKQQRAVMDQRIDRLLGWVGLEPRVAGMFPHELSGGMKQRVCIAMAIALEPRVIVADEPTSALDVVVQRVVMQTLRSVQERLGASLIIIGHDMGLMAQYADRLGIMYAGRLVEVATVRDLFKDPGHPYTRLLISSLPSTVEKKELKGIPGITPSLLEVPQGCAFHPRCPFVMPVCREKTPRLARTAPDRLIACHLFEGSGNGG